MKKVIYEAKAIDNEIEIVCLADLHVGSSACNIEAINETIEYIKEKDNRYFILNGDLIDGATKNSPGASIFDQEMSVTSQIGWICEKLKPIINKCINYVPGNHEYDRQMKEVGISPADIIATTLCMGDIDFTNRYCPDGAYSFISVGNLFENSNKSCCFTMFNLHGTGGGTKIGAKIQKLDDMRDIVPADFYVRSHTHEFDYHAGMFFDVDRHLHDIRERLCYFINTSSFLRYNNSYGARAQMKPIPIVVPIIKIKVKKKNYTKTNKKRSDFMEKEVRVETLEF